MIISFQICFIFCNNLINDKKNDYIKKAMLLKTNVLAFTYIKLTSKSIKLEYQMCRIN